MGHGISAPTELKHCHRGKADLVTWDVTLSTQTEACVDQLARDIGGTREDVFRLALALFTLAVEAKHEGKRIAIVDDEGNIDTEIKGF
jgi:hypothetical protein